MSGRSLRDGVRRVPAYAAGLVLLAGLVVLATYGPLAAAAALVLALGVTLLVVLGPERMGVALMVAAMFTAPENSLRPIAGADFVTFSDVFFLLAAGLLLPTMLRGRATYPLGWLLGGTLIVVTVLVASALSGDPGLAFAYGLRLPAAAVVVPLVLLWWRPDPRRVDQLAWAYVAGHCVSTVWALQAGKAVENDRYQGLTTHFNFFGMAAVAAAGLLFHLHGRTSGRRRWVVYAAAAVVLYSVMLSGSRSAAIVVLAMVLLNPLLERSIASAYALVSGALVFVLVGDRLLSRFGSGSAFARLHGDDTTTYSDSLRTSALTTGWHRFLQHPLRGNGFDLTALDAHNIYLEVAIGIGVVGLLGWVLVLATATSPMLRPGPMRRLGYVGFGYAAEGLLTNSLWDRFEWMALALALLAAASVTTDPERPEPARPEPARPEPARGPGLPRADGVVGVRDRAGERAGVPTGATGVRP